VPELIGAQPPAAPVVKVVEREVEEGKGSTGVPVPGSPGLRRWRSGGDRESSGAGHSGLKNGARRSMGGVVGGGDDGAPFYRVVGGAGRPDIRGEWVAVVVHHNGGGGGRFRRGSIGMVVGCDEGGGACSGRYGSKRGTGRRCAHAREAVAAAVGPGRKMTEQGSCVGERGGWLAGSPDRLRPSRGAGKAAQREGRVDGLGEGGDLEGGRREQAGRLKAGTELWKIVQGDFEGIWTWRFFLKSLTFSRDFRKMNICHAIICNLSKII
jgi:hypothetical protein